MPTPTIPDGELFMNATLYTGTGANQNIVNGATGQSFQPDLVWVKSRSAATNNRLVDSVRGNNYLVSNSTAAEVSSGTLGILSNGFIVGTDSDINNNGSTYVGWQWKAGGTAVTNTAGSISAQVSANTTSGFSIVTFTSDGTTAGGTIGHGLGVAPSMVIYKGRNTSENWFTYHVSLGGSNAVFLNLTSGSTSTGTFNSTTPTSSVIQLRQSSWGASNLVAYCWAPIAGYSAFGSYTGNGSTNGPFVYCGFRPRFILLKSTSSGNNWEIFDSARNPYNQADLLLLPSSSAAESSAYGSYYVDFVSNGFKIRGSGGGFNASGETMIYAAFAENPFKYANAR